MGDIKEGKEEMAKPIGQYGMTLEDEEAMLKSEGREFKEEEGPQVEDFNDAWSGFFLYAESVNGTSAKCSFVGADGYYETARVAVEMALTLKLQKSELQFPGGLLTPAVAGGTIVMKRLTESGVKF